MVHVMDVRSKEERFAVYRAMLEGVYRLQVEDDAVVQRLVEEAMAAIEAGTPQVSSRAVVEPTVEFFGR